MSTAEKLAKKTIRITHSVVNTAVLLAILFLLVFASYAIWDTGEVHRVADASQYNKYKPNVEEESASFEELRAINPEVFAWLNVYGTHIDYPIVQGYNNLKYVNTDALGNYSLSGAIFLDYQNSQDFTDFNNIFYGHHMEKNTMFGEVGLFSEKGYFNAHQYGMLYHGGKEYGLEFFAFVHTDAYDNEVFRTGIIEQDKQQMYLDRILQMAIHTRENVQVTTDDRLVLLSTCSESSTNGRDILVGRIIDKVYPDPFEEKKVPINFGPVKSIDELPGLFMQASLELKLLILLIPLLLLILVFFTVKALRKRKHVHAHGRDMKEKA